MAEPKEVCKICYGSTSHKPNPTLTPESRTAYDTASKKMKCSVCRQEWAPIRVAKEVGSTPPKWVRIRQRPKIPANIDFQICKNVQSKVECPKGQDCSYAHSRAELFSWNKEREKEPRPAPHINGPYQYTLCKHMLNTGTCPYGQRCTFAHSDDELRSWLRIQAGGHSVSNGAYVVSNAAAFPTPGLVQEFRCEVCNLTCTSQKQLDDHISGARHKQQIAVKALHAYNLPTQMQSVRDVSIRRRPTLSFPINGYKLCLHTQAGRRCIYGDYCTFAHSELELEEWNSQLQFGNVPRSTAGIARFQNIPHGMVANAVGIGGDQVTTDVGDEMPNAFEISGLDDFEEEFTHESHDFAYLLRTKIASEHKRNQEIQGFEKTKENVTITEVSGQRLSITLSQPMDVHWTFEISVNTPRILHSVVLFDMLASGFTLDGVWLVSYGGHQRILSGTMALQGTGLHVTQKIAPPDKLHVKISLKSRMGILGQLVLFNFGSFYMTRGLCVHVLSEQEGKLLNSTTPRMRRPAKPDLYWEQRYPQIHMNSGYLEVTDRSLPEYPLPEQIERLIEAGKYSNVENKVSKENYKRRMHNLLYLEEYQQRVDMSRYDLYNIEISPHKDYRTPHGVSYAPEGFCYIKVAVDEVLYEGGRSVRVSDGALLLPMNQHVVHECHIEHVGRESIIIKITDKAKQASLASLNRCSIRFFLSRVLMRSMHYAVDRLDLDAIFPTTRNSTANVETPEQILKCLEIKNTELYTSQQNSINSMLDPACRQIPSLVLGPFGCGKTRTLAECIKLLTLYVPDVHILVCTHSNSAANLYVESIDLEWRRRLKEKAPLFRLYFTGRRLNTVTPKIQEYCRIEGNQLVIPSLQDLKKFKVIVSTLHTSRALSLMGMNKGHFSHIFIDEAAQALESESLIPICLANENTKIVLAGDHMQMDPPVYSKIAGKYGLQISLLERLYDHEAYDSGVGQLCKTLLTENHRSHQQILELPSKLFYKNRLTCRAIFPPTGPKDIPAIKFIGVDGQETQEEDSPSYYNDHESIKICEQVELLVSKGLQPEDICVLAYYTKQVQRIRNLLRGHSLSSVIVCRVDDIQGREYRALLLSTVRTCSTDATEDEGGFLSNPKLFNTAVTRAREWLIVVGEPITLCTVGSNRLCWMELFRKCNQLGSFEYPNAAQFETFLETRLVARQILEKNNDGFLKKIQSALHPSQQEHPPPSAAAVPPGVPPTPPVTTNPALGYIQAGQQMQHHILRSKVIEAAQSRDEPTITRITDELLKIPVDQQAALLTRPDIFTSRVREMEQVLRRAGPTAAVMSTARMQGPLLSQASQFNAAGPPGIPYSGGMNPYASINPASQLGPIGSAVPAHSIATLTGDLPVFLARMIEALTTHVKWCEFQLQNPHLLPEARENLLKQKTNLGEQMKLVNEQINLYRELAKVMRSSQAMVAAVPPKLAPNLVPNLPPRGTVPMATASQPPPPPPAGVGRSGRGEVVVPAVGMASQSSQVNSAFTYGVSPYLSNTQDQRPHPQSQLTVQTTLVSGGKPPGAKMVSPLDAAISSTSNRSSPLSQQQVQDDELYVSDDEFI